MGPCSCGLARQGLASSRSVEARTRTDETLAAMRNNRARCGLAGAAPMRSSHSCCDVVRVGLHLINILNLMMVVVVMLLGRSLRVVLQRQQPPRGATPVPTTTVSALASSRPRWLTADNTIVQMEHPHCSSGLLARTPQDALHPSIASMLALWSSRS